LRVNLARIKATTALLFSMLIGLLCACRPPATELSFFHVVYANPMPTLNPILATDLLAYTFLHNIHEGLMSYDEQADVIYGLLQESQVSQDGLRYDLFLRENLYFSDGTPLTMQEVQNSWLSSMSASTAAPFAHLFDVIQGANAYRIGQSSIVNGLHLVSPLHLQVELERPFFFFLELLANPVFAIISPAWQQQQQLLNQVSGAYLVSQQDTDGTLYLVPNRYHYAYDEAMLPEIKVSFIANAQVAYQLFRQQQAHWVAKNFPLTLARQEQPPEFVQESLPNGSYFILFNHKLNTYQDVRVRQALAIGFDREELASLLEEQPEPSSYLTPFGLQTQSLEYNPVLAAQLIAQAGYSAENPLVVRYSHSSSWMDRIVAEYLQDQWQKLAGVQVHLEMLIASGYRLSWARGEFELQRASWFMADYEDAYDFLHNFTTANTFMQSHYHHEGFEALLNKAHAATNLTEREAILLKAQELLLFEEYATVVLFAPKNYHLIDTDQWQGFVSSRRDIHLLRYIRGNLEEKIRG
jgi:oligopeptide transport system substrate-binding protein